MADSGKLASFTFAATVYDQDDCVQSWDLDHSINEVLYQCGGYEKAAVGNTSAVFTVTLALAKTDTAKLSALAPGTIGTFEAHPGGDSASNIEITSTQAVVISAPISTSPNDIISVDLTIRLNDITIGAAI